MICHQQGKYDSMQQGRFFSSLESDLSIIFLTFGPMISDKILK
jgi:hypothetical protein